MTEEAQYIRLAEQSFCRSKLTLEELQYLTSLKLQVIVEPRQNPPEEGEGFLDCQINPNALVGHFVLPSGRLVVIEPKIETASIFRMLAYVFTEGHRRVLHEEDVHYEPDALMFEPLVELFNVLVSARVRRGLVQDYMRREENLGSFRGALNVTQHIQQNLARDNRIHCRFFEQTVDVPDNRLIKRALHHLVQFGGWTQKTMHGLIANFHHFDPVTLDLATQTRSTTTHYHRLNDDYRPIHQLCRMFLASSTISERVGALGFRGFLLDMNQLFENFVQKAFENVSRRGALSAETQRPRPMSFNLVAPDIKPDITIRRQGKVEVVADAKYKKDEGGPRNPDIYQVIAYGTVLQCPEVFLLYPQTEIDSEHDFPIINSSIIVKTRRVDISSCDGVERTEALAHDIIRQCCRNLAKPDIISQAH